MVPAPLHAFVQYIFSIQGERTKANENNKKETNPPPSNSPTTFDPGIIETSFFF
jgi:hypothetical protein